ncbi:MAG: hypothetical protein KA347_09680 [Bacteroidia bacterium]|nr:hypothetical protein [Bacteroidia bacterium]MBP7244286.1 hypothetical protein [Bacteroidia bacterium]
MYPFKKIFFSLCFIFSAPMLMGQKSCACCTDNHKAFDFWVGDWIVYDTSGNKIGENNVEKIEKNCIINEHWTGGKESTGSSYNYFDSNDSTWNQVWIDNQGGHLILKGHSTANKMILRSKFQKDPKGNLYCNRITWTLNADGSVTQRWDIADEMDALMSVAFIGIYRKKTIK